MPTALMLTIQPLETAQIASNIGRAAHAAILGIIDKHNSDLAARIHDSHGIKPLTVSNLFGIPNTHTDSYLVNPSQTFGVRVTLLSDELEALFADWSVGDFPILNLNGVEWRVVELARNSSEHPWAGAAPFGELAAPVLKQSEALPTRWTFEFVSPVVFRQNGRSQPLPTPYFVWGSLLDKWNAFAPLALPEEIRRFASDCMVVSRFTLRSEVEKTKNGVPQVGAVGRCTYVAINRDRHWLSCIDTLARFGFWAGIGAGTARGFGQVRLVQ